MTTVKISEPPKVCMSKDHNPATHVVRSPGTYQHTCPSCGASVTFTVPMVIC